jgi:hypothetical protein
MPIWSKPVQSFALGSGNRVYALAADGDFRLFPNGTGDGDVPIWSKPVQSFALGADNRVYALAKDGDFRLFPNGTGDGDVPIWSKPVQSFALGSGNRVYALAKDGDLRLFPNGTGSGDSLFASGIHSMSLQNGELWTLRMDGTTEVTPVGDISSFMTRAMERATQAPPEGPITGWRGVQGTLETRNDLVVRYGDTTAPQTILDSVVSISTGGSGTLLQYGGNRFVLTANHVVSNNATGALLAPSQITVNGQPITNVWGSAFFGGRDVALIQLTSAMTLIQGAMLPQGDPWNGIQLLVAGYGLDNAGLSGSLNFGFATYDSVGVDPPDSSAVNSPLLYGIGAHLKNAISPGEAQVAPGDSGGPDFLVRQRNIGGLWTWIPEVVGVHSYNDETPTGNVTSTMSVQLTNDVVQTIRNLIGLPTTVVQFFVRVIDNGDGDSAGAGEWRINLNINGTPVARERSLDTYEGILNSRYSAGRYEIAANENGPISVSFWGYEADDGFFTGGDDDIPRLDATTLLPSLNATPLERSLGERHGDTAYELFMRLETVW